MNDEQRLVQVLLDQWPETGTYKLVPVSFEEAQIITAQPRWWKIRLKLAATPPRSTGQSALPGSAGRES